MRRQLRRMMAHRLFSQAERLKQFLEFVVETSLDGRATELTESTVGVRVFDRDPDFDPKIDPIVRVEAGRLRRRIEDYYRARPSDPVLIVLPKGAYQPLFRQAPPDPAMERPVKIVVLSFRDLSDDQDQEYFCEAITEQITGILPKVAGLWVVAHTSALGASDRARDVRQIGRDLGAELVLEGSVQRSGRRIRVSARACRTRDGLQIWSRTYDRQLKDVLALQDDVSTAIARNLEAALGEVRSAS